MKKNKKGKDQQLKSPTPCPMLYALSPKLYALSPKPYALSPKP